MLASQVEDEENLCSETRGSNSKARISRRRDRRCVHSLYTVRKSSTPRPSPRRQLHDNIDFRSAHATAPQPGLKPMIPRSAMRSVRISRQSNRHLHRECGETGVAPNEREHRQSSASPRGLRAATFSTSAALVWVGEELWARDATDMVRF